MSAANTDGSGPIVGRLEVHLGWNIHPTGEWIDTDLIVEKLTGIIATRHMPYYALRFTSNKANSYTFNDSNGEEHPADVGRPGDHNVEPFTAMVGPHIKSVYVPFGNPNE
ncbi:hypothetical protein FA13DRAFT_1779576 [Coprinellus micaceus]|uniref:Uncharacterized protein n=1 Tax=Coprinellus micaceus TaxID=71717 RepID=A0A4Y7SH02_COPMI|nr:hypothetical protein FA13DRAFT_1779576 [Coprinellus micaceus]